MTNNPGEAVREFYRRQGEVRERERIIKLLIDLDVIRVDALGYLVAMDTHGQECVYLTGLMPKESVNK